MRSTAGAALECPTESAVLHTLLYFELFSYPLQAIEVFQFCSESGLSMEDVSEKLINLAERGVVFQYGIYFQTVEDLSWVSMRQDWNRRATKCMPIAHSRAKLIGNFPFVRGVFVSGSLSKHCMRPDSDVDFFVITEPGRLWLARTLLMIFKKVFLFNSHKYFCVNYLISADHPEIEEKNRFTATETVTLLPMYGREYCAAFRQGNDWAWIHFPHFPLRDLEDVPFHRKGLLKMLLEKMLGGKPGVWLDEKLMRLTAGYWKKKFNHLDSGDFEIALKSRRYVSKHHPLHFQKQVLERFEARR